ncbi:uncharacterized protein TRAVEDRAFT_47247 [Trametes versicolor FP-101664 SS1]|uniref:uncharacterized protein n=1 Tax=Trametes versicolor (strain FP-101664) TaxID=717944 RepID=UPI00046248D8|nr:uncharacterized protein TRAVEDRAFT_47247 [Trametes versicolor FP-101664 SS1]EIW59951.1 hypothetical protein TRAVEDRAFT_47247 [Trametes versicolor FP-101664 SS1]
MRFSAILALISSIGFVMASPAPAEGPVYAVHGGDAATVPTPESGCGSYGPLGNSSSIWYIVRTCTPGARMSCQATDHNGCVPGDTTHINSLEVDDPNDTFNVAKGTHVNTVVFNCPEGGQVRCQVDLDSKSQAPNYSLRTFANAD